MGMYQITEAIFWNLMPCIFLMCINVSDERVASLFYE